MGASTRTRSGLAAALVAGLAVTLLLAACGPKKNRPVSQTAARVNKDVITRQQIAYVLQQLNVKPEQADAAAPQVLERLIDQQLALQRADDLRLDREPRVQQQLEAARREIIARAYFDKVAEAAQRPTDDEIHRLYEDRPALFKERRVYSIQEITIEATPDQVAELREQLRRSAGLNEFIEFLRRGAYRFGANLVLRTPEQLSPQSLNALSRLQEGEQVFTPTPTGASVVQLAGVRSQPLTEAQARPAIEQMLLAERRRRLVEEDAQALRRSARIEYQGAFATLRATAPVPGASAAVPAASEGLPVPGASRP
ncbi:MAG: peptidyl-prolyl cis-trans isomerase, EpsD family [Burkholderiales bacterium]|nr:peptidyl-prolyl cis-trans isomerase, EpsD family [Burkholderiales bacterium]